MDSMRSTQVPFAANEQENCFHIPLPLLCTINCSNSSMIYCNFQTFANFSSASFHSFGSVAPQPKYSNPSETLQMFRGVEGLLYITCRLPNLEYSSPFCRSRAKLISDYIWSPVSPKSFSMNRYFCSLIHSDVIFHPYVCTLSLSVVSDLIILARFSLNLRISSSSGFQPLKNIEKCPLYCKVKMSCTWVWCSHIVLFLLCLSSSIGHI